MITLQILDLGWQGVSGLQAEPRVFQVSGLAPVLGNATYPGMSARRRRLPGANDATVCCGGPQGATARCVLDTRGLPDHLRTIRHTTGPPFWPGGLFVQRERKLVSTCIIST